MHAALKQKAKKTLRMVLRHRTAARNALMRAAAARGRCLVLCYHRIAPDAAGHHVISAIPPDRFAEQMRALRQVGEIVPVNTVLSFASKYDRPVFAVTFDDDDPCHVRYALPVLQDLGIPATFFLSGRSVSGCAPYWWTLLEQSVAEVGLDATCRMLGHRASTAKELARICRTSGTVTELATRESPPVMEAGDMRTLAAAGMTIGFHTLRHAALPQLHGETLAAALTDGRDALEAATGEQIELLAYPYGRADARVADAARRAGYVGAFVTAERPVTPRADPFLLGRWQPGQESADEFLAEAALRLTTPVLAAR
jgi:peptidoglycan/xylan/chitin deacetylase (PgdA/CDA1 family)